MTNEEINARFKQRARLFADGAKGAATQGFVVFDRGEETTMSIVWVRKNRGDPGTTYYDWNGTEYPDARSMLVAYAEANP